MTHSTVDKSTLINMGSVHAVLHTIDVTSTDGSGTESYDPAAETGLNDVQSVSVVGQEDGSNHVVYDHLAGGALNVNSGGAAVAGASDIGEVKLLVVGR